MVAQSATNIVAREFVRSVARVEKGHCLFVHARQLLLATTLVVCQEHDAQNDGSATNGAADGSDNT